MAAGRHKIGRFTILRSLGRGAQGAVYLARDPHLDRFVAIKLLADPSTDPELGRFTPAQARNLAQLRHPNIIALYEAGRLHSFSYLVFEYLPGGALRSELDASVRFSRAQACSLMLQLSDAMAYAHAKGILHLDLNPNNIMRDANGKPRIMDFDLSRALGTPTPQRRLAGTLSCMAPEYFTTRTLDTRTDVFALGQIFYELLAGRRAVPLGDQKAMLRRILTQGPELDPLREADPDGRLTAVVVKATRRNPDERYADARALHAALSDAWEDERQSMAGDSNLVHGTVAFVLRRIERRGDFPAVSRSLMEINLLTSADSRAPISRLAGVILRDYALASRLLRLANSSFYSRVAGQVKTVSDAIARLGVDQVRLTCNGLVCFGHFSGSGHARTLREMAISGFIAGLITRHLASQWRLADAEELFLAGMLFNLGGMLALFYFPEDYQEMQELIEGGASEDEASATVLGITLMEMGAAVGRAWGLPPRVIDCMVPGRGGITDNAAIVALVRLAAALATVNPDRADMDAVLLAAVEPLAGRAEQDLGWLRALLEAAIDRFHAFAPALEVDTGRSECVRRIAAWLKRTQDLAPEAPGEVSGQAA